MVSVIFFDFHFFFDELERYGFIAFEVVTWLVWIKRFDIKILGVAVSIGHPENNVVGSADRHTNQTGNGYSDSADIRRNQPTGIPGARQDCSALVGVIC